MMMEKNSLRSGSTRRLIVSDPEVSTMKFVTQETMQTVVSGGTLEMLVRKASILVQGITCAATMKGRSRQLVGFICRLTLESPTNAKTLDKAIVVEPTMSRTELIEVRGIIKIVHAFHMLSRTLVAMP